MTTHELAVIGYLIVYPENTQSVAARLSPDDMSSVQAREIYNAIIGLHEIGVKPDLVTIVDFLSANNVLASVGGAAAVAEIVSSLPDCNNIEYYLDAVLDASLKRRLKTILKSTSSSLNDHTDATSIIEKLKDQLDSLTIKKKRSSVRISDISSQFLSILESGLQHEQIPTYIPELDALMGHMRKGELIIIAARPSVGKTAFAVNMMRLAAKNQIGSILFSLEMPREQIFKRLLCLESGLSMGTIENVTSGSNLFTRVVAASDTVASYNISIYDDPLLNVNTMLSEIKKLDGISLVFVDYMQLMSGTRRSYETRQQEVSAISHGLKVLARKIDMPVIALSQLNRNIELRGPHARPILADIRESGAIEQDADRVIFLHRMSEGEDGVFQPQDSDDKLLVSVAKNRNGPTGDIILRFKKTTMEVLCD